MRWQLYKLIKIGLSSVLLCLSMISCSSTKSVLHLKKTKTDSITILVTDSGLGGISVAAYLEQLFRENPVTGNIRIIFANALYESGYGYNSMETVEEKVKVFDAALYAFNEKYSPDLILVACNTLSVIYPYTSFSTLEKPQVFSIVDNGVNLIQDYLLNNPESAVIIAGTETTINQNTHREKLLEEGFQNNRIVTQAFPSLESEIQMNPNSDMVISMIEMYAYECVERCPAGIEQVGMALCCTHYPYSARHFKEIFEGILGKPVEILDPNRKMAEDVFTRFSGNGSDSRVEVTVVSRALISEEEQNSISSILEESSPRLADALRNYHYDDMLFQIDK